MKRTIRRVFCHTLGCDKNIVDSEALLGYLQRQGAVHVDDPAQADIWLLNTCGFIAAARHDSEEAIKALAAAKEHQTLVVTGCLAQEHGPELQERYPAIDVLGGVGEFGRVTAAALARQSGWLAVPAPLARYEGFLGRPLLTPGHVAFVKLGEGCSKTCTFCRIPMIRGPLRSRPVAEIVDEVRHLVARGVGEIQLVSQNTSDYGRGTGEDLEILVRELSAIDGLRWIRLLYLYPGLFPAERILRILELPRVVPYLDLPVQHASRRLLRAMKRPGDPEHVDLFFHALRRERPDLVLRTTVLLGFPGEEEQDVEQLLDFMAEVAFDHLGTYCYSPEQGTPAAALPDRPMGEEVADREARVMDLQAEISANRKVTLLGRRFPVVIDEIIADDGQLQQSRGHELSTALLKGTWRMVADREGAESQVTLGGPLALGRSHHFGYDLDGTVVLPGSPGLAPGAWCEATFLGATAWDIWAET